MELVGFTLNLPSSGRQGCKGRQPLDWGLGLCPSLPLFFAASGGESHEKQQSTKSQKLIKPSGIQTKDGKSEKTKDQTTIYYLILASLQTHHLCDIFSSNIWQFKEEIAYTKNTSV